MTISRREVDDLWQMAEQARALAQQAHAAIIQHEAVCAERYKGIAGDLTDIKNILKWAAGLLVTALSAIAWAYLRASLHI